jgi:Right handed beta helix region
MRLRARLAILSLLAIPALLTSAGAALATNYYVAPLGAVLTCPADGSQACPFASISTAFAAKKIVGGDTVLLMDGDFGGVQEKYWTFDSTVTIQSLNGSNAHISWASFGDSAKNITLKNLKVWRDEGDPTTTYLIRAYTGSSYLTFENLDIRSREDGLNYMSWSLTRWVTVASRAFDLRGTFSTVRNNKITAVIEGIIAGPDSLVENNVIDGFAGDGMKAVSRSTFRGNRVTNAVNAFPDYHADGLQSYTPGDPITDLVVENNTIIQWTNDPASPLKGELQGIGMFDGWYDNLTIRNNLIITDHYHGIAIYGTRGATILNNTVVDLSGLPNTSPWIKVTAKKDGSPSQNVLVANNLAMQFQMDSATQNLVMLNNSVIFNPLQAFVDITKLNYLPTAVSGFIDSGDVANAPLTDILGTPRPQGVGPDRGAYEIMGATNGDGGSTTGSTESGSIGGATTGGATTGGATTGGTTATGDGTGGTSGGTTGTTTGGTTPPVSTTPPAKTWYPKFLKPPVKKK